MSYFVDYFNIADEIDESLRARADQTKPTTGVEPLTLADLDERDVHHARLAADELNLPWPPHLTTAEELLLRRPELAR
jgi:hypothetical protein